MICDDDVNDDSDAGGYGCSCMSQADHWSCWIRLPLRMRPRPLQRSAWPLSFPEPAAPFPEVAAQHAPLTETAAASDR